MAELTSAQIALDIQGILVGSGDLVVSEVASLQEAGCRSLSFLGNEKYRNQVMPSKAAVVLVPEDFNEEPPEGRAFIKVGNPSEAFSRYVVTFAPPPIVHKPGIHPDATVSPDASVADSATVCAQAVIESGATIGERSVIGAGVYVGQQATIGDDCLIYPNVMIRERCRLANRVIIHGNTTIGSDGFGFDPSPEGHKKIPQYGIVQVDDDVEIGANCALDRARFGRTWIKQGAKIDNLVQIAHNVIIGEHCFVVAQVGVAGSTTVGKGVILAGQAGLPGHIEVGDGAIVMAKSGVFSDVEAGQKVLGYPALPRGEFLRNQAAISKLPDMRKELKALRREVAELRDLLDHKDGC